MKTKRSLAVSLSQMEQDYRYDYLIKPKMKWPHIISLAVSDNLDCKKIMELLNKMHKNETLSSLKKGIDYEWFGLSAIAFSTKEMICLFLLFM